MGVFFLLIYVFWPVESEVHFCRPEPENLDNLKKKKKKKKRNFPDSAYREFQVPADKYGHRVWIQKVRKPGLVYQSGKLPLSRKFRVDNSECHAIAVTKKRLKTPEMK